MMESSKKSALTENKGIAPPEIVNSINVLAIKNFRKKEIPVKTLIAEILKGNISYLSRAISIIESTNPDHFEKANLIIEGCLPFANNSNRIGITGVPGVGKSTFIEAFGNYLTQIGKKVAVLAVDPTSTISNGSILGDKTRMEELVKNSNAFIRPSASGLNLGGVARKTRETIILCEAAGFDTIIIETVGVGQSETTVHSMVDFFLLLQITGAGDELQGIKRGIMEMADAILINKADGENITKTQIAKAEFSSALQLFPAKKSGFVPKVLTASSILNIGIDEFYQLLLTYFETTKKNGFFEQNRQNQNLNWMLETINEQLLSNFYNDPKITKNIEQLKQAVLQNKISPFLAAKKLLF